MDTRGSSWGHHKLMCSSTRPNPPIDNDENKIDDDWEALEEEDCKFCDEKKRNGRDSLF